MTDGRRQSLEYGNPDVGWLRKRRGCDRPGPPHPYTACAEHLGHAHSAEADAATASRQQRAASRMRVARLPATPHPF
jgi:hypothetical protein